VAERSRFVCQGCGYASPKWLGRCPECGVFATLVEERTGPAAAPAPRESAAVPLDAIALDDAPRLATGCGELDRVLGGGLVPGSVVLIGGDPGIGKTTLLLQHLGRLAAGGRAVLYCSAEESARQIRLRAERLGLRAPGLLVLAETSVEAILGEARRAAPAAVVVDSVQTVSTAALESAPGSIGQVRESAAQLIAAAKRSDVPLFLVGHVTKEGALAGPRVLEHMVDTVLSFEGDPARDFRILRAVKNRFGSTNEIGVFEMGDAGLLEVANPSRLFLRGGTGEGLAGSVTAASVEGTRPLLVEVQALCARSPFASPRRGCSGADAGRLAMLLAILEKRIGLVLGDQDVYLNLAGGIRVVEPAADLPIALALCSSFRGAPFDPRTAVFGEVGLTGEVRAVSSPEARVREAGKLGFDRCILPRGNLGRLQPDDGPELIGVSSLEEAIDRAIL